MTQEIMGNHEEFYVLGLPIETEIGLAHFLKVKEFPRYLGDLQIINMSVMEFQNEYRKINKDGSLDELIADMDNWEIFELFFREEMVARAYERIFVRVFRDETVMERLTRENFGYYREMIMRMNVQTEEEINPNPEIQRAIDRQKNFNKGKGSITMESICTSIVAHGIADFSQLMEWSIYQMYSAFQRIGQIKNYETTTLFSTVPMEKPIEIEDWSKHIDLFAKDDNRGLSRDDFNKKAKLLKE